jgi:predicted nuclease of predicted toxin-antitoxin system
MKLLFDQNLSPALPARLADLFPASSHVRDLGLDQADDRQVWALARQEQFVIITQDNDFNELSQLLGYPPYVIWIRRGNSSTRELETLIRQRYASILDWEQQAAPGLVVIL